MGEFAITKYKNHTLYWSRGTGNKKYKVVVEFPDGKRKTVQFGAIHTNGIPYEQYKDRTPLGLYSKYDHLDPERRKNYRKRHGAMGYQLKPFSSAYFSWHFLW